MKEYQGSVSEYRRDWRAVTSLPTYAECRAAAKQNRIFDCDVTPSEEPFDFGAEIPPQCVTASFYLIPIRINGKLYSIQSLYFAEGWMEQMEQIKAREDASEEERIAANNVLFDQDDLRAKNRTTGNEEMELKAFEYYFDDPSF